MALQTPVELNKVNDNIIYHTTIPIYLILIIASVLGIGIAYKRFRLQISKNTTPHEATDKNNEHEMDTAINPHEVIVDIKKISATFPSQE